MAQKAVKQLASRNAAKLNQLHLISLAVNGLFILLRFIVFRSSLTRNSWLLYLVLSAPAFVIEFFFERNSRPSFGPDGDVKRAGDDLEAKGLTEYMHDVLFWTWGCTFFAALLGNRAWYLWVVVPAYSAWLAFTTFSSMRQGLAGMAGQEGAGDASGGINQSGSKRQQKLEKRGGQRVQYR